MKHIKVFKDANMLQQQYLYCHHVLTAQATKIN